MSTICNVGHKPATWASGPLEETGTMRDTCGPPRPSSDENRWSALLRVVLWPSPMWPVTDEVHDRHVRPRPLFPRLGLERVS